MIIDAYRWQPATIRQVAHISSRTVAVTIDKPTNYRYTAGQYTIVRRRMPGSAALVRQYSFSSPPDQTTLELTIQKEPYGQLSGWFHDFAQAGDQLEISQPFGAFTWYPSETRPLLLVAGGSGIAPCMSIIRHHAGASATTPLTLHYSVRQADHLCFYDELQSLATPRQAFTTTTDTAPRLSAETLSDHLTPDTVAYICGSKRFIGAMHGAIVGLGLPPSQIKHEAFTLS